MAIEILLSDTIVSDSKNFEENGVGKKSFQIAFWMIYMITMFSWLVIHRSQSLFPLFLIQMESVSSIVIPLIVMFTVFLT